MSLCKPAETTMIDLKIDQSGPHPQDGLVPTSPEEYGYWGEDGKLQKKNSFC